MEESLQSLWDEGHPADFAWFALGPERIKNQYQDARSEHAMAGLRATLEGDVKAQLAYGDLIAIGFLVQSTAEPSLEIIKSTVFKSNDMKFDWDRSRITWLNREYREVRIVLHRQVTQADQPVVDRSTIPSPRAKAGRRDTYSHSRIVLEMLHEMSSNRDLSPERLHTAFCAEFEQRFPNVPAPSVRTLRKQLKRFRKESEEIGNNVSDN